MGRCTKPAEAVGEAWVQAPRIYYIHHGRSGVPVDWRRQVGHAADLGFDHVCAGPIFAAGRDPFLIADLEASDPKLGMAGSSEDAVGELAALCAAERLPLFLDIVLDRLAADGTSARAANGLYEWRDHGDVVDPRHDPGFAHAASVRPDAW